MATDQWQLLDALYADAKRWWRWSLIVKMASVVFGIIVLLTPISVSAAAAVGFLILIANEAVGMYADFRKGFVQRLRDRLDLEDSLGWPLTPEELRDIEFDSPASVKQAATASPRQKIEFDCDKPRGPVRALENLEESAWWSRKQAETVRWYCAGLSLLIIVVSVLLLLAPLLFPTLVSEPVTAARVIMGILGLIPTLGLAKTAIGYHNFARLAQRIEQRARDLLVAGNPSETEAVKLVFEYQSGRSSAPILPTFLYNLKRDELNRLWSKHKGEHRLPAEVTG